MRVILADDSAVVRDRLKIMMADLPGIELIGEAATVSEADALIQVLKPDVVILDIQMPDGSGIDVLRHTKRLQPAPVAIMLTNYPTPQNRGAALEEGAEYFLDKFDDIDQLAEVLRALSPA